MSRSPLLHGSVTGTPLDLITKRLYFIWPLSKSQIEWLNTIVYNRYPFWINYWSFTHFVFGIIWGVVSIWVKSFRNVTGFLIFHTVFEIWELWAGGYLGGPNELVFTELVDIVMDTLFALLGYLLVNTCI